MPRLVEISCSTGRSQNTLADRAGALAAGCDGFDAHPEMTMPTSTTAIILPIDAFHRLPTAGKPTGIARRVEEVGRADPAQRFGTGGPRSRSDSRRSMVLRPLGRGPLVSTDNAPATAFLTGPGTSTVATATGEPRRPWVAPEDLGRVLFVNENLGGHATMHLHLFQALAEHPDLAIDRLDVPRAGWKRRVAAAQVPGLARLDVDLAPLRDQLAQSLYARRMIRRRLVAEPVSAIHAYSQHAVLLSSDDLRRLPSVVSTDGSAIQNAEQLPYRRPTRFTRHTASLTERLERRVFEAATIVVAQSEYAAGSIRERYDLDDERLRVIPFGIIPFAPAAPRAATEPLQLTIVGNGLDRKGYPRLLRVFRTQLRDRCELNVVTRDDVPPEPGVRVFAGLSPGDARLVQLLGDTAVFVLPSEIDKSPYSILEAMFAGVPVVSTFAGGIPELVENGVTGFLVDQDDDLLGHAILKLLDSESLRARMGAAGRARALARFDARETTAQLLDVIVEARARFAAG